MKRRNAMWMTPLILGLAGPAPAAELDDVQSALAQRLDARIESRVEPALEVALREPVEGVMAWARAQTASRMRCRQAGASHSECLIALRPPRARAEGRAPARLDRDY